MASYYKYKSREGEDQVDWRAITKGITDDITRIKGDRDKKREDIDKAALLTFEDLANKPQGPDVLENKNIANYAAQQEAFARQDLALLKNGGLTLQQYTARTNTAQGGTKRLFNLSKKYQDSVQNQLDSLKPDENGIIQASGMNAIYKKMVERFSNPSKSMYYVDPETRESFLAIVTDKEGDDVVKIDDKAYSLLGVSAAEDIILRNDARYQSNLVADNLAEGVGDSIKVVMEGEVLTEEDAFKRIFALDKDGNLKEGGITEEGKTILTLIKATFASDDDYSSMLFDTLGYVPVAENENGKGFTNLQTGETINKMPDNSFLVKTINGRQVPQIDDTLKDVAHMGVLKQIRTKLDIKETNRGDTRATDAQKERAKLDWAKLGLEKKKFNKEDADEASDLNTKREVISTLYGGTREDINSALTYYKDYGGKNSIQKVDRFDSGITITYENEFGDIVTSDVSFYVPDETAKTMMPNPNYDPNKEEDAVTNPKEIKGRLKTEAQFIQSASQLLIGESVAEGLDDTLPDGSLKYNRPFTSTPGMSVENTIIRSEGGEDTAETFNISIDKFVDEKLSQINLMDEDKEVAPQLTQLFEDLNLKAEVTGGAITDEIMITIPGFKGKPFMLTTDYGQDSALGDETNVYEDKGGQAKERQRFKIWLSNALEKRSDLFEKLKFKADPKKGKFSKYNN